MPNVRLRLKTCGRAAIEVHFQPLAGNEVLKGFALKLTPMYRCKSLRKFICCKNFWGRYKSSGILAIECVINSVPRDSFYLCREPKNEQLLHKTIEPNRMYL